jgi:hypothetical protein
MRSHFAATAAMGVRSAERQTVWRDIQYASGKPDNQARRTPLIALCSGSCALDRRAFSVVLDARGADLGT